MLELLVLIGIVALVVAVRRKPSYDPRYIRYPGVAWVYPCFWCRDDVWTWPGSWNWAHVSTNKVSAPNPEDGGTHEAQPDIAIDPEVVRSWKREVEPELVDDDDEPLTARDLDYRIFGDDE